MEIIIRENARLRTWCCFGSARARWAALRMGGRKGNSGKVTSESRYEGNKEKSGKTNSKSRQFPSIPGRLGEGGLASTETGEQVRCAQQWGQIKMHPPNALKEHWKSAQCHLIQH